MVTSRTSIPRPWSGSAPSAISRTERARTGTRWKSSKKAATPASTSPKLRARRRGRLRRRAGRAAGRRQRRGAVRRPTPTSSRCARRCARDRAVLWSTSRGELWRKGETSGDVARARRRARQLRAELAALPGAPARARAPATRRIPAAPAPCYYRRVPPRRRPRVRGLTVVDCVRARARPARAFRRASPPRRVSGRVARRALLEEGAHALAVVLGAEELGERASLTQLPRRVPVGVERLAQAGLQAAHRERRVRGDPLRERERLGQQLRVRARRARRGRCASASRASMTSPVKSSSAALLAADERRRGARAPRRRSRARAARRARRSARAPRRRAGPHSSASSMPQPTAAPFTAAITGTSRREQRRAAGVRRGVARQRARRRGRRRRPSPASRRRPSRRPGPRR